MGAQGSATLDFGAFPGTSDTTIAVTGQTGILAGSDVEAWILPATTADHSVDEHRYEDLVVMADTIVAGTGFTIFGRVGDLAGFLYGKWNIGWVWA